MAVVLLGAGVLLGLAASASGVAAVAGHDIRIDASGSLTTDQAGVWNVLHSALVLGLVSAGLRGWSCRYPGTGTPLASAASS